MSRITAIICGVLLFGLGLFFGMVGSFIRTLSPETPQAQRIEVQTKPVVSPPPRVATPKPSTGTPPAVESALSQALAMVAVAMASQPESPAAVVPSDVATNAPDQHPLELLMPAAAGETASAEPPANAPPIVAPPPPTSQPDPLAGHWVFDQRLGWLWLRDNTPSVVIVPVIEVFPGGMITIHSGSGGAASKASRRGAATPPTQQRRTSVIQHDVPGSTRRPATSPFPNKD